MPDETCGCGFVEAPESYYPKIDPTACKYPALKDQVAQIGTDCVNYITNGGEANPQTDVEAIAAIREFWSVVREELQSAHQFSIRLLGQVERAKKRIGEELAKIDVDIADEISSQYERGVYKGLLVALDVLRALTETKEKEVKEA